MRVRREKGTPRPRRRVRKRRLAALLAVLFVAAGISFTFGLVRAVASEIPALDPAAQHSDVDTVVYASNGRTVLAVLRGDESRVLVGTDDIAPIMRQAIVSVEDQRFFEHNGIDVRGVGRALWQDVRRQGIVEGGSTITQQFVKNAYIRNERTLARKVREAALAWQLEQRWSKDRILTAYLNTIYFGHGAYGIQQAARAYFKKSAKELDLAESALLAGIPADPSLYDPAVNPRGATLRRRHVLAMMLEQGKITQRQYERADKASLPAPEDIRLPGTQGPAPYFVNYVKDDLVARYGAGRVFGGGLKVTTTIDLDLQLKARAAIEKILGNPDGPAAALVAIDPRSGAVKAMFGGRNFRQSQFNLAAQAKRQPGSAFKPIVLATAMNEGISPVTTLESKPVSIDAGDRIWKVTNYDHTYLGRVSLSRAIVSSDNSVYAQLTDLVGPKAIVKTAHSLGIRSRLAPYFSIGLGSGAVSPLEMARAYATLANEGRRVDGSEFGNRPRVVETVERIRSRHVDENAPIPTQVMDEGQAELLTDILEDVVQSGTGKRAAIPGREIAGKTGTTDNYGDAWFVGYTPELVVAVWVGYPDALRPMLTEFNGEPVAGGTLPAMIWKAFMEKVDEDEDRSFDSPPYLGGASTWVVRRDGEVGARQRVLPRVAARRVLLRSRPRHGGRLQAERGVRAARRRDDGGGSRGDTRGATARREDRLSAGQARGASRPRRRPGSATGRALGARRRDGRRHEGAVRPAPELRRLEPGRRAARGDAPQGPPSRQDRSGPSGDGAPAGARARRRRRARHARQARGRGRLTNVEPASE